MKLLPIFEAVIQPIQKRAHWMIVLIKSRTEAQLALLVFILLVIFAIIIFRHRLPVRFRIVFFPLGFLPLVVSLLGALVENGRSFGRASCGICDPPALAEHVSEGLLTIGFGCFLTIPLLCLSAALFIFRIHGKPEP